MFGKCHRSIPDGQEGKGGPTNVTKSFKFPNFSSNETRSDQCFLNPGARCKVDRDCGASMCCARHHGEQVCKRRLMLDESCYVPDGGLAFSINQICPCDEGLLCRESSGKLHRE